MVLHRDHYICWFNFFRFHFLHCDDLKRNLSETNRVRASTMFIEAIKEISSYTTIRYPCNKTCNTTIFTGVPPHVMIIFEMEYLKTLLEDKRKDIAADLRDELNKRHIGGYAFEASSILEEEPKPMKEHSTP